MCWTKQVQVTLTRRNPGAKWCDQQMHVSEFDHRGPELGKKYIHLALWINTSSIHSCIVILVYHTDFLSNNLGVIVMTAVSAALYRKVTRVIEARQFQTLSDMVGIADQAIGNIRTVRSFGGEFAENTRFDSAAEESLETGLAFGRAKAKLEGSNRLAIHLSLLALFGLGGSLVRKGLLPYSTLVTAIGYTFSLVYASQGLVSSLTDLRRASSAVNRLSELLSDAKPVEMQAIPESGSPNGFTPFAWENAKEGDIEFRDVGFAYPLRPDTPVLNGLNLTLKQGTVTALVGQSGSGKSTISSLLSRFYEPDAGHIYLNGISADQYDKREWIDAVALVSQDSVLFRGSIYENICYGKNESCDVEAVMAAAKAANAHEFVLELPDSYDTMVGERGALLSGQCGQQ